MSAPSRKGVAPSDLVRSGRLRRVLRDALDPAVTASSDGTRKGPAVALGRALHMRAGANLLLPQQSPDLLHNARHGLPVRCELHAEE